MADTPVSLRSELGELDYQEAKRAGKTRPLELAPAIKQWEHWRLIDNEYPYDLAFRVHHMLLPKRAGVKERWELNQLEKNELELIVRDFVHPTYDMIFENTPHRRSMNHIYHLHVVTYFEDRGEMGL